MIIFAFLCRHKAKFTLCVFFSHNILEMETVDANAQDDEVGNVVKEAFPSSQPNATAVSMSGSSDSNAETSSCSLVDDDLYKQHIDHIDHSSCLTEAACSDSSSAAAEDMMITHCQATDATDVTRANESEPSPQCSEDTPTESAEDRNSVESISSSASELEDGLESSPVKELEPHSATSEDDGWMYVLGHDQLKKRVCIAVFRFCT